MGFLTFSCTTTVSYDKKVNVLFLKKYEVIVCNSIVYLVQIYKVLVNFKVRTQRLIGTMVTVILELYRGHDDLYNRTKAKDSILRNIGKLFLRRTIDSKEK